MKPHTYKNLSLATLAFATSAVSLSADSFKDVAEHLDLDGTFVSYIDFDGDGQEIGEKLNVIYQELSQANPNLPPFPLDFPAIFETLGFGSLESVGMSSVEIEDGLFRNRSVSVFDGEPAGLFRVYDMQPIPFRAAEIAPADATTVFSGKLDLTALTTTVNALASQVMGPMGEGMVLQGLSQPVPGTDLTVSDIVDSFSNGIDVIMHQSFENPQMPDFKLYVSLKGAKGLAARIEPMLTELGVQFVDTGDGRVADLSIFMQGSPFGMMIKEPADSDDLILYTDADWVAGFGSSGGKLVDTEAFKNVAGRLPKNAAFYVYSVGIDISQLESLLQKSPDVALMAPAISHAVDSLFGGFLAPSASATYLDGETMITEGYSGFSYKGALMALPAGIGAGVGAGIAIDRFSKQQEEQESWEESAEEEPMEE